MNKLNGHHNGHNGNGNGNGNGHKQICGANRKNCTCGYRYSKDDSKEADAVCPKCGQTRKCQVVILGANGRCRVHGGKSLYGPANPNFHNGRYSSVLPGNLFDLWQSAATDPDLTSHREDVLLLQTRLLHLLKTGESTGLYDQLAAAWEEFEYYSRAEDQDGMKECLAKIDRLIRRGKAESAKWHEIYGLLRDLERGRMNERRRLDDLQQMIPAEKVVVQISALIDAVRRNISDPGVLSAISADFGRIIGGYDRARLAGRNGNEGG